MTCPPAERLAQLLDDRLDVVERDALETHLGECTNCQQALLELAGPSVTPANLSDPASGEMPPAKLLERLRQSAKDAGGRASHDLAELMQTLPAAVQVEVLEEIGRGGTSVVYKVRQIPLNRVVAMKVVPIVRMDSSSLRRNRRGVEALARLTHPGIVQIFEVGRHEDAAYGLLELMAGGSLKGLLRDGSLAPDRAARLVADIAEAVHFIHQQGIIHRDLKSSNVLLTADGVPKVADFGLAKRLDGDDDLTRTGDVLGTPAYMAPEQAMIGVTPAGGAAPGVAADVYSVGIILYELLTGRPPFHGATALDTLYQVVHLPPMPPSQRVPRLPRDLEIICLKCLQKEPELRYRNAQELADDLRRFVRAEPIRARPVGRLERVWKWTKRRPRDAASLAAIFVAMIVGIAILLVERGSLKRMAKQDALLRHSDAAELREAQTQRNDVETQLYRTRLALAKQLLAASDTGGARKALEECIPRQGERDYRDAEWRDLFRRCSDRP